MVSGLLEMYCQQLQEMWLLLLATDADQLLVAAEPVPNCIGIRGASQATFADLLKQAGVVEWGDRIYLDLDEEKRAVAFILKGSPLSDQNFGQIRQFQILEDPLAFRVVPKLNPGFLELLLPDWVNLEMLANELLASGMEAKTDFDDYREWVLLWFSGYEFRLVNRQAWDVAERKIQEARAELA